MSISTYVSAVDPNRTPQSEPLPGAATPQVQNEAGGYGWAVDDWRRLARFLVLGSEGGTYYTGERKLTQESAAAVRRCLAADGPRVVREVVAVSEAGRAPKQDPALFILALALTSADAVTRQAAAAAVPRVCRIGTHLFALVSALDTLGGWGPAKRKAIGRWYTERDPAALAYQLIKYQNREGWSHRDVLRMAHPKPPEGALGVLLHYAAKGWPDVGEAPHPDAALRQVGAFERAKRATTAAEGAQLVRDYDLPRECVPSVGLNDREVWAALLEKMPLHATVRNLAKMTAVGLLAPLSDAAALICRRLADADYLRRSRMHPLALLVALKTYAQGHGERGKLTWTPVPAIVDALDAAFYDAFGNVAPTGKRWLVGVDWSESMGSPSIAGMAGITPAMGATALAMLTASVEPQHHILAFATTCKPVTLSPRQRLDDALWTCCLQTGEGTDCSVPIRFALQQNVPVDVFAVLTDNQTWAGAIHPAQALKLYRQRTGIDARMVVVGMAGSGTSIADPDDAGMLDVVGLDTATPGLMAEFAVGTV